MYDVLIIGGGVVGSAIARELSRTSLRCGVLEKEADVAEGISKANSGVLHAGFNVPPESLKARFNVEGLSHFPDLAEELDVPMRRSTKLVVAKNDAEKGELERLLEQGMKNGSGGLSIVGKKEIERIAPGVTGEWALYSRNTGVINPFLFTVALAENALQNGVDIYLNSEVAAIEAPSTSDSAENSFLISTSDGREFTTRTVVNAAGLGSANIARMVEPEFPERIYPCRGEYHVLDKEYQTLLDVAVYPVPIKDGRGLGVHLTPTTNGNILFGPSAEYIESPRDTSTTAATMRQLLDEAYDLLPALRGAGVIKSYSGIRPKLFTPESGTGFRDYHIEESHSVPGFLNLVGIESPGLTAAPAIASYVRDEFIATHLSFEEKTDFLPHRTGIPRLAHLDFDEASELCRRDPEYGEIFCRCEGVSKAEIRRAIENPLGVKTLNAIKKRTYSMMGRCRSGFCLPRIIRLLIDEYGLSPEEIRKNKEGTEISEGFLE